MVYKQVRADDNEPRTNVQVSIGKEGGKPVFEPYGKAPNRIRIDNGHVLALADAPVLGADGREYFKVLNLVDVPTAHLENERKWIKKPLPGNWPKDAYVKGLDLTTEFYFARGSVGK